MTISVGGHSYDIACSEVRIREDKDGVLIVEAIDYGEVVERFIYREFNINTSKGIVRVRG